jgi:hypothetical protein
MELDAVVGVPHHDGSRVDIEKQLISWDGAIFPGPCPEETATPLSGAHPDP